MKKFIEPKKMQNKIFFFFKIYHLLIHDERYIYTTYF